MKSTAPTVEFTQMADGTAAEYQFLELLEKDFSKSAVDRVLAHLRQLKNSYSGYKVSRLEHALQSATRAWLDGADEETIVVALLHDIGDMLSPENHGELAAAILKPYVSPKNYWILKHHGIFQGYYYFHHLGGNRNLRDQFKDHEYFQACADFCKNWDQVSFDPNFDTKPLEFFEPMVRKIFAREPFGAHTLG